MNWRRKRVIILATSPKTHGGISAVLNVYKTGVQWKDFNIVWIATHSDRSLWMKMGYMAVAFVRFLCLVHFCDIVHIHTGIGVSLKRKRVFFLLAGLLGKKRILHMHIGEQLTDSEQIRLYKPMIQQAEVVVLLAEKWKTFVLSHFQMKGQVRVLHNPCPVVNPIRGLGRKPVVLFAGCLTKNKGYQDLIAAFSSIANKHKAWKVIFAGSGEIEEAKQLAAASLSANQFEFAGWIQGEAKAKLYSEASIFCLPSYAEGFPMTVLEAWEYEIPVVCTPVGALAEIGEDRKNVLFFPSGEFDQLAALLDELIGNEDLRRRLASCAKIMSKRFSATAINRQVGLLYADMITS